MSYEDNITKLGLKLPDANAPAGNYVATKIVGNLLYVSGQISIDENGQLIKGKVGLDLTSDQAYSAAKRCGLSIISQAKNACKGDLSKIKNCVKLTGFVNSTAEFTEQPKVINGASDLIAEVFGENGKHTRAAVSTNSLPLGVAVEVDAIFELN
jgi:enamine deaminase RidA (YjgF/YER057c/UK114 family)